MGTYHSPLPDPRTESPLPDALGSRVCPAAAEAKLEGSCTGMVRTVQSTAKSQLTMMENFISLMLFGALCR